MEEILERCVATAELKPGMTILLAMLDVYNERGEILSPLEYGESYTVPEGSGPMQFYLCRRKEM